MIHEERVVERLRLVRGVLGWIHVGIRLGLDHVGERPEGSDGRRALLCFIVTAAIPDQREVHELAVNLQPARTATAGRASRWRSCPALRAVRGDPHEFDDALAVAGRTIIPPVNAGMVEAVVEAGHNAEVAAAAADGPEQVGIVFSSP